VFSVLEKLKTSGIISSISSKNDYEIAINKLKDFGIYDYFIYPQISWADKSISVKKILNDLHLRPQNILFVDDSTFERDAINSVFPDILLNDASDIMSLLSLNEIKSGFDSKEAKQRIDFYRLEEKRIKENESYHGNNEEFLMQCHIKMSINVATESDINRIEELVDRTNQLNSTGVRYSKIQIIDMLNNPSYMVYVATVWDKYGSYGQSGIVIAKLQNEIFEIDLLIISCRLMGKGIAQAILAYCVKYASQHNYKQLQFLFKRNEFNRQMLLLYTMNGFKKVNRYDETDIYNIDLQHCTIEFPEWIELREGLHND